MKNQNYYSPILLLSLAVLGLAGCTSLPPVRSARSLSDGKSQGNVIIQSVNAHYTKDVTGSGPDANEDTYKNIAAVGGEFRSGTQVPGMEVGLGLGSLSSMYLDFKEQFLGHPWRQGFAAAIDLELDYFPWTFYSQSGSQFSSGFGGSAGLILSQYIGICDLSVGGRFGSIPAGTMYAYYTLFDLPGMQSGASNYYEFDASLDFNVARSVGISLGTAYRTYINQVDVFSDKNETLRLTLPGFFLAAITMSFGGQVPLVENEVKIKSKREQHLAEVSTDLIDEGKQLMAVKDYTGAATAFRKAEFSGTKSQSLDMLLGYCYFQLEDWASSLSYYRKALIYAPDDAKIKKVIEKLEKKVPDAPVEEAPLPE